MLCYATYTYLMLPDLSPAGSSHMQPFHSSLVLSLCVVRPSHPILVILQALLRAQRMVFQGDLRARAGTTNLLSMHAYPLTVALIGARELNRALLAPAIEASTTPEEKTMALLGARQAAQYLRENVLQGVPSQKSDNTFGQSALIVKVAS